MQKSRRVGLLGVPLNAGVAQFVSTKPSWHVARTGWECRIFSDQKTPLNISSIANAPWLIERVVNNVRILPPALDATSCQQCGEVTHWEHIALANPLCSRVCGNRFVAKHFPHGWVEP